MVQVSFIARRSATKRYSTGLFFHIVVTTGFFQEWSVEDENIKIVSILT